MFTSLLPIKLVHITLPKPSEDVICSHIEVTCQCVLLTCPPTFASSGVRVVHLSWAFNITQKSKIWSQQKKIAQVLPNSTCAYKVSNGIHRGCTWFMGDKGQFTKVTSLSALCQFHFLCWVILNNKKTFKAQNLQSWIAEMCVIFNAH